MIMSRLDSCDTLVEHYLEVIDFQKEFKGREKSSLFPGVLSLALLLTAHLHQSSITRIYERPLRMHRQSSFSTISNI